MQSSNPGNAAERSPRNTSATVTQVVQQDEEDGTLSEEQLRMRLDVPDNRSRVHWTSNTVDNENMGKKKSKCCCIYKKKRDWNESESSDEDCESRHCRGHMECHRKPPDGGNEGGGGPGPSVPS